MAWQGFFLPFYGKILRGCNITQKRKQISIKFELVGSSFQLSLDGFSLVRLTPL